MVYVLDGLLYTLSHWPKHLLTAYTQSDRSEPSQADPAPLSQGASPDDAKKRKLDPNEDPSLSETGSRFFKRTDSVLVSREKESTIQISNVKFFGVDGGANLALENPELVGPPNQWGKQVESFSRPLHEEYPLASRPHLLKPFAKKEALFGVGRSSAKNSTGYDPSGEGGSGKDPSPEGGSPSKAQDGVVNRKEAKKGRKRKHLLPSDGNRYVCDCPRLVSEVGPGIHCLRMPWFHELAHSGPNMTTDL